MFIKVIHTFETGTAFNRPRQRTYIDNEFLLQFIQQIKRIFRLTVHLVDKYDYRGITHTAYFHQLTCLRFHTFRTIHHNNDTIYGCQSTISILGKVLMARSIQNIDFIIIVIKLHHRSGHRNTTLLFNVHPIGCGGLLYLITLYGSGHLYLSAKK